MIGISKNKIERLRVKLVYIILEQQHFTYKKFQM